MRISIIGTAGRKEDKTRMSSYLFLCMCQDAIGRISYFKNKGIDVELCSGGAAWADHVAIRLFLDDVVKKLFLFLPAEFLGTKFEEKNYEFKSAGSIANYYHLLFSEKVHSNTLLEIQDAITKGAVIDVNEKGFLARNFSVGKCDILIAYTWGDGEEPKDGGTAHTWNNSNAKLKMHIPLSRFQPELKK